MFPLPSVLHHEHQKLFIAMFIWSCVYVCGHVHMTAHVWRSEDNTQELVLAFHHMSLRNQTRLSGLVASI